MDSVQDEDGGTRYVWDPAEGVNAVAYDTPITGWRGRHVNTLRLWSARATDPLRLEDFNRGDHVGALADRVRLEAISRVLYPSDETAAGHELRLRQEYFFASASLQDLLRRHKAQHGELASLADHVSIQLNDTHPAIAVPELMRLLIDVHGMPWELAWNITTSVFNYTNHTLLPEALETWPVSLLENMLPRHMQIIYLINALHLDVQRATGMDDDRFLSSISLIEENQSRRVRMGHLAFLGSHRVNGVSALHTELMRRTVFRSLHTIYPERIVNKTNGITFRRWLFQANPGLTEIIVDAIGTKVLDDVVQLEALVPFADDASFRERFHDVRRANKVALARLIAERLGVGVDPEALFDVQIKRIHEYKRQLLNILETIAYYNAVRAQPTRPWVPRVKIFAGKAAAGYHQAKLIIKLAQRRRADRQSRPGGARPAEGRVPAELQREPRRGDHPGRGPVRADLDGGMEASGTGNMKLALNGALTIGTLDGANIEIRERVGAENMLIFGLTADQVAERRSAGLDASGDDCRVAGARRGARRSRDRRVLARGSEPLSRTRRQPPSPRLFHGHRGFRRLLGCAARGRRALAGSQRVVAARQILNTARMGWFSADRAVLDYARDIWGAEPSGH